MEKLSINNINIFSMSLDELHDLLDNYIEYGSSSALITTFNLDFLRIANSDDHFKKICKNSLCNLPDGFWLISLLKKKYKAKINRITGNDLFPLLIKIASKRNLKIAIIGGTKEVSDITHNKIMDELNIASEKLFCLSPPFLFEKNKKLNQLIINDIINFCPDIVFAALGCPRQELWLNENMHKFKSKLNIGIGATLDYYSQAKRRSPLILQKIGLEWAWRLINEPSRLFKRYILKDMPFYLRMVLKISSSKNE